MRASLLLIGGGHAHVTALRWLKKHPSPDCAIRLINPGPYAVYSGMLPGFVGGHYKRSELEIDLVRLCREAGVELVEDEIVRFDPETGFAEGKSGQRYSYDLASIDVGIVSTPQNTRNAEAALIVKPMAHFVDVWEEAAQNLSGGVAIIGAGLGGVELAFSVRHNMRSSGLPDTVPVSLIDRSRLLSSTATSLKRTLRKSLANAAVDLHENAQFQRHAAGRLTLESGVSLHVKTILWAAGARSHDWLVNSGLETLHGFPCVSSSLQSVSHPDVFITGDAASLPGEHIPRAGVIAVRQGPVLMENMIARSKGEALRNFVPQGDYLKLVTLGKRSAIAEKWGLTVKVPGLWTLKRLIDQSFVQG